MSEVPLCPQGMLMECKLGGVVSIGGWLPRTVALVSSSLLGPVVSSFRALSGPLKITVRHHKFNEDSPLL